MSFFESLDCVFHTKFSTLPKPESNPTGGAGDWNKLANRPFGYVEHVDLLPETSVTVFGADGMTMGVLRASGTPKEGFTYPVTFDGVSYQCTYKDGLLGNRGIEGGEDTGEPFLWYVTESSILTTKSAGTYKISIYGDVPQRVPYEYLPFGHKEAVVVMPQTTTTMFDMDEMWVAEIPVFEPLPNGTEYTVVFNGTEYHLTGIYLEGTAFVLGNLGIIGGEDTGEPFMLMNNGVLVVYDRTIESAIVSVIAYEVKKIPYEILPEAITVDLESIGFPTINISDGADSTWVDRYIYEQVKKASAYGIVKLKVNVNTRILNDANFLISEVNANVHSDGDTTFFICALLGRCRLHMCFRGEDLSGERHVVDYMLDYT